MWTLFFDVATTAELVKRTLLLWRLLARVGASSAFETRRRVLFFIFIDWHFGAAMNVFRVFYYLALFFSFSLFPFTSTTTVMGDGAGWRPCAACLVGDLAPRMDVVLGRAYGLPAPAPFPYCLRALSIS